MKISNSKKQLAKIISENGGWREGAKFSAQDKDGEVFHYSAKPTIGAGREVWGHKGCIGEGEFTAEKLPNWHQTILSRDEYFHLYPAQDADGWIEWRGGECPLAEGTPIYVRHRDGAEIAALALGDWNVRWTHDDGVGDVVAYRLRKPEHAEQEYPDGIKPIDPAKQEPTIEQLAAEYRNRQDYAERKQQEADAAKADAEAKLAELVAAGKAVGLAVSVAAPEPELVITDWRDLREGDVIRCVGDAWGGDFEGSEAVVTGIESPDYKYEHRIRARIGEESDWGADFHFIRRPAKETTNA